MKRYGLGLGMVLAGLVFFLGSRESHRGDRPVRRTLPDLPNSPADATTRLYQRHPDYLHSLSAIEA